MYEKGLKWRSLSPINTKKTVDKAVNEYTFYNVI